MCFDQLGLKTPGIYSAAPLGPSSGIFASEVMIVETAETTGRSKHVHMGFLCLLLPACPSLDVNVHF